MDKLAMEEAGFRNSVSILDGAPPQSSKDLPYQDKVNSTLNSIIFGVFCNTPPGKDQVERTIDTEKTYTQLAYIK